MTASSGHHDHSAASGETVNDLRAGAVGVTSMGAGPDVVIAPGLAVTRYFAATQRLLARRVRAHLIAFPGIGNAPDASWRLGLRDDAVAMSDWLRGNIDRPVVLVGHSYGSQVAACSALLVREKVRALVLAGPTVDPAFRSWHGLLGRWLRDTVHEPAGLPKLQRPEQRRAGVRRIATMVRSMLADDMEVWLRYIDIPVTVVRGEREPLCSAEWAAKLADRPGGRLVTVPGAVHAFPYDRPAAMADAVLETVDGVTP